MSHTPAETTSRHTPGPWRVEKEHAHYGWRVSAGAGDTLENVCVPCYGHPDAAMTEANARLIAAAPDLLDMLKQYDEEVAKGEPCFFCATSPHLRLCGLAGLIAKAEGR